jgi:SEC-C motif-containing protein
MRSRYTAYSLRRSGYLTATWDPTTRPQDVRTEPMVTWLGLKVLRVEAGGADDREGTVEFVARYKVGGRAQRLHEVSRFLRRDGRWFYVDGDPGPTAR